MSLRLNDIVGDVFHSDEKAKAEEDKKTSDLMKKLGNVFGVNEDLSRDTYNPFLTKEGELFNPYIDYQKVLDSEHVSSAAKNYIQKATGLSPTVKENANTSDTNQGTYSGVSSDGFTFNPNADTSKLMYMDVVTELPKLSESQISAIISKHFSKSPVIKPSDAAGIYAAQQETGMSALAVLGIGALESGWGTSNFAVNRNNFWGWAAYDSNPNNASSFSQISQGAKEYSKKYLSTFYNGYGAKSIYAAGSGENPAGLKYASDVSWAHSVGNIMATLYNTAKSVTPTNSTSKSTGKTSSVSGGGSYKNKVGQRVANTSTYKNDAALGQCVWYVRGRAKEKLGKDPGAMGNANQMYYNAKKSAQLSATTSNIKPNILVSYGKGTSSAGQKYGHVIFIEDVVGDTVYYTEGGSGYYKNGTDGVVKTATKQGILNGVNSSGTRMGSNVIGFVDLSKY